MTEPLWRRLVNPVLAIFSLAMIGVAAWHLHAAAAGVSVSSVTIGDTPARVYRPIGAKPGPVVVIAHGFAGSQQLMTSFAQTFARNGYVAVTFDFPGHGRNPRPLTGSLVNVSGATRVLVDETARVAAFARTLGDGRLAALGHSMASDIVVRFAQQNPDVVATIAVSMFSPAVTPASPRDLLVIVGDWEGALKKEALRVVSQAAGGATPAAGVTYGDVARGTGRRAVFSDDVEHIGVLYSRESLTEALAWLDGSFGITRATPPVIEGRGPWILLLLAGIVLLARPLSRFLPVVTASPTGAALPWRRVWPIIVMPAIVTPLLLRLLPTHFLPVLLWDYIAAHFAMYGGLTAVGILWARRHAPRLASDPMESQRTRRLNDLSEHELSAKPLSAVPEHAVTPHATSFVKLAAAALALMFYGIVVLGSAIDREVTSFIPTAERAPLILAMLAGTLAFFLADEWLTRGDGAARGAYAASKVAFLLSLALAVALDFERLFFLVIIVPVMVTSFLVFGLFSAWAYRATRNPFVAGIANASAFAWAIGVTFPLLVG